MFFSYDSIPSDLGAYFAVSKFRALAGNKKVPILMFAMSLSHGVYVCSLCGLCDVIRWAALHFKRSKHDLGFNI